MSNSKTRRTPEQWQSIIDQQIASELSAPKYCKQSGIAYQSFAHWRNKLATSTEQTPTPTFIELSVADVTKPDSSDWLVELDLAPGIQLRIAR